MEIQTFSEEEKEEIIRYGLDKIKNSCMMSAVTLLMGYAFHVFLQSIVFLICFIALRKYAGGYHADTQKRCYVISEYSCAMKSHFRKFGNQMSGSGNHLCNYASLLA